jgi:copper(I)-binding protein
MKRVLGALLPSVTTLATADAQQSKNATHTLSDLWARATVAGQASGAAYLTIRNDGATDRLISAAAR